jgi:transcriptional regulator with XRE-family HTH domain
MHVILGYAGDINLEMMIMNIKIGPKIKMLRVAKGITQEKLAKYFGVSCQAVSKWESESSYPDLELIPALANFFSISSDELLGIDILKNKEIIHGYVKRYCELSRDAPSQLALMREALAKYPNSFTIMQHLMYALVSNIRLHTKCDMSGNSMVFALNALRENHDYDAITSKQTVLKEEGNRQLLSEAIAIAERILDDCTDDDIRHSAIQVLCFYYPLIGRKEKAMQMAEAMPSMFMCREFLKEEIFSGEEKIRQLQRNICMLTDYLCCEICAIADPDLQQKNIISLTEKIHLFELSNNIYQQVFEDGDYNIYHCRLAFNYRIIAIFTLLNNHPDDALTNLENAASHAVAADSLLDNQAFTSLAVNHLEFDDQLFDDNATAPDYVFHQEIVANRIILKMEDIHTDQSGILLRKLEQARWDSIRNSERFKAVVGKLIQNRKVF